MRVFEYMSAEGPVRLYRRGSDLLLERPGTGVVLRVWSRGDYQLCRHVPRPLLPIDDGIRQLTDGRERGLACEACAKPSGGGALGGGR